MTLIYAIVRWRKAPAAFRAIVWIAAANLVAGALIGFWTAHLLGAWSASDASRSVRTPGGERTLPSSAGTPTAVAPRGTPTISGRGRPSSSVHTAAIVSAYVGQALAQRWAKGPELSSLETWPQVAEGCRLGNYQSASTICKAATLATAAWGDTQAISNEEVASFCDAGYLEKELHLCRAAYISGDRPASSAAPKSSSTGLAEGTGIPESDVAQELAKSFLLYGPTAQAENWKDMLSSCASGLYATRSPMCEAANVRARGLRAAGYIEYGEVASFCDVKLISRESEVCRAAYHFADASGDDAP